MAKSAQFRLFLECIDASGKVAIVTGPTSGIGKEVARKLVRLGARVILAGRNEEALKNVTAELQQERSGAQCGWKLVQSNLFSSL